MTKVNNLIIKINIKTSVQHRSKINYQYLKALTKEYRAIEKYVNDNRNIKKNIKKIHQV